MPTYVYRREDGTTFEIEQSIKDDALTTCPTTGQPVSRIIAGGTGLIFKGSGFYLTDYARKSDGNGAASQKTKDGGGDAGESKSSDAPASSTGDTAPSSSDGASAGSTSGKD